MKLSPLSIARRLLMLLPLACLVGASAANAAVVTFANRVAFDAAFPDVFIENWDSYANGTVIVDGATLNGITYNSSAGNALVTNVFLESSTPNGLGDNTVGFFQANDSITFSFGASRIFGIDINTFALNAGAYTATTSNGDVALSVYDPFPGFGTGQFIGFLSDTAFTSVTIAGGVGAQSYTLDTLRLPEPSALVLIGLGLAAVFVLRRLRAA